MKVPQTVQLAIIMIVMALPAVAQPTREAQHEKLEFLVGAWDTTHAFPSGDGDTENYSPSKEKYNFYMFDHFGGEAGVSADEVHFNRAFSDDGEHYHFELKGVYTRKKE